MADICRTRTIAVQSQAIWNVLADFGAVSSWADNVDHSCVLHSRREPIGTTRRVQIGRTALVERICEFDPPNALAYEVAGLPRQLRTVRNRWRLRSTAAGATTVTLTSTVEIGPRPLQKMAEHVVARVLAKQSDVMLAGLASRCELETRCELERQRD